MEKNKSWFSLTILLSLLNFLKLCEVSEFVRAFGFWKQQVDRKPD